MWGATDAAAVVADVVEISIHAPRVGSDLLGSAGFWGYLISIHAPRVGSDVERVTVGTTWTNFNPRSPCGERRGDHAPAGAADYISIHAPRVGSDWERWCLQQLQFDFNPRSPCGERQGVF